LAAGLLTIEGRQGENRGQASRKSQRNLREKISEPTSLSSRSLLANPQLPRPAEVGVKPRLAWLGRHSAKTRPVSLEVCNECRARSGSCHHRHSRISGAGLGSQWRKRNARPRQLAAAASFMHAFAWVDPEREAHPGGNVTGIARYVRAIRAKQLELGSQAQDGLGS
jgi:hypothetical protein